jgi:hypothetical protein
VAGARQDEGPGEFGTEIDPPHCRER